MQHFILKEVKLEVTHQCPLSCIHCSSEATPDTPRAMSSSMALNLIEQIVAMNVSEVAISGGEPMLWPGILELIRACTCSIDRLTIYTSGNVVNFDSIISKLHELRQIRLVFSIFASNSELHERITRIPGSFQNTIDAVIFSIANGIEAELHFVPLTINYLELPSIIALSRKLGIKKISILRFVPQGRGASIKEMVLSKTQNLHLRRMIIEGRKEMDIRVGSPYNILMLNDSPNCLAAIDRVSIGPEYDIYPCDAFKQIKANDIVGTGEYSKVDKWDLKACWGKSPYLNEVRKYLKSPFVDPCRGCNGLEKCLSGCLAQKVLLNSGFRKDKDPMCLKVEEN
jgi:radical SAM protein with 4Fe4S-binding SPASM domain